MVSIALTLFFILGAVSAADNSTAGQDISSIADETSDESILDSADLDHENVKTSISSNDTKVKKGEEFSVELKTDNGTALYNKTVHFEVNSQKSNALTDKNGIAKIKINLAAGKYTVKYSFNETGFEPCQGETKITVTKIMPSKFSAKDFTAYVGIKNKYTVTLTSEDKALANRIVTFKINGKTITKKTNSKGKASLNINLAKGVYNIKYYFAGDDKYKKSSGTSKITVKKGAPVKISKVSSSIFRHKKASYFKAKLVDANGNPVAGKKVTFKVAGKTYTKKTNKNGIASVKIKLKLGSYNVKVNFKKDSIYKKASKKFSIKVKPKQARNNGMWILSTDMKSVNFNTLQKYGTKHIFVNAKCLERFGKSYVESWIKQAKSHGIKVHIWMQVFYTTAGGWVSPVSDGKIKYDFINSKVNEAKTYAKIKGVAGVHFDYIRFPGDAYQHKNGMNAINYFTKKASNAVHGVNKKLIVSAAVMPEPSSMKKYYGQDIPTMSKYLDVIVPMVYKGNYHAGDNWIKQVTKTFAKQCKKAKVWTGLQTYRSDERLDKVPAQELMGDADAAALGGAYGVILFRYGLIDYINFNEV